eukprot:9662211-Alexandrium_andersonii.AAC.1
MSASLVGSEMCIRDRAFAPAWKRRMPVGIRVSRSSVQIMRAIAARASVSYTHLTLPTICSV